MKLRDRACRVSLDYSDGLCTTHSSHNRAGSEVGLDTYGKTSHESTNPIVYSDLLPLGHSFMSRPGSGDGSSWRRTCPRAWRPLPAASLGHT